MAATAEQIAAAKQLAAARGYDPNLVDADNADRASTAFPGTSSSGGALNHVAGTPISTSSISAPNTGVVGPGQGGATPGYTPLATSTAPGAPAPPAPDAGGTDSMHSAALVGFQSALSDSQATQGGGAGQGYYTPINPRLGTRTPPALIGLRQAGVGY